MEVEPVATYCLEFVAQKREQKVPLSTGGESWQKKLVASIEGHIDVYVIRILISLIRILISLMNRFLPYELKIKHPAMILSPCFFLLSCDLYAVKRSISKRAESGISLVCNCKRCHDAG